MNFLSWYKNIIESSKPEPPVDTWDNIRDQLDIDSSWEVIDKHLRKKRFIQYARITAAASILILSISAATWLFFSRDFPDEDTMLSENITGSRQGSEQIDKPAEADPAEAYREEVTKDTEKRAVDNNTISSASTITAPGHKNPVKKEPGGEEQKKSTVNQTIISFKTEQDQISTLKPHNISIVHKKVSKVADLVPVSIKPLKEKKKKNFFRKIYLGTSGQLANTWLVNQKTISGFKSTSLVSTNPSFGSNFGIYAGTNLASHLDLQMDLNLLAQNNQDYNEYLNGSYVSSNMKFNYSQLALSLRYNINSSKFMEGEHGLNFGPYLAYLHSATQNYDNETITISGNYHDIDYGLLLGYEYVFPLYEQLGLGTGFRAYYGLSNIYAGNESIPGYLNITNNASVNITLSLKYRIK
ncbi:MAG TPA: porin family protein [Bacteroidales bacterium]|nr:porin family protein [Bacteroidales bacterium]